VRAPGLLAKLLESKVFVKATNPWTHPRLRKILEALGKAPKTDVIIRLAPPWAKSRLYLKGASEAQLERWEFAATKFKETAGLKAEERIPRLHKELATGRRPRKARPARDIRPAIRAELEARRRAPAVVAPTAPPFA